MSFVARNHPQQTDRRGAIDVVDDRRTPPDLLAECASLAGVGGFDLDVAATADNTKAPAFYVADTAGGGLFWPWRGRVWCNPPYSDIRPWIAKAHEEAATLNVDCIAMLLPANRTEQSWWQDLVEPYRLMEPRRLAGKPLEVYFLAGRRRFDRPGWTKPAKGDRPPFGLCLLVWQKAAA